LDCGDILHVLISHLHGDNVAGLRDLLAAGLIAVRPELGAMDQRSCFGNLRQARCRPCYRPIFASDSTLFHAADGRR